MAAGLVDTSFAVGTTLGVAVCTSVVLAGGGFTATFATAALFAAVGLTVAATLLNPRVPVRS